MTKKVNGKTSHVIKPRDNSNRLTDAIACSLAKRKMRNTRNSKKSEKKRGKFEKEEKTKQHREKKFIQNEPINERLGTDFNTICFVSHTFAISYPAHEENTNKKLKNRKKTRHKHENE